MSRPADIFCARLHPTWWGVFMFRQPEANARLGLRSKLRYLSSGTSLSTVRLLSVTTSGRPGQCSHQSGVLFAVP